MVPLQEGCSLAVRERASRSRYAALKPDPEGLPAGSFVSTLSSSSFFMLFGFFLLSLRSTSAARLRAPQRFPRAARRRAARQKRRDVQARIQQHFTVCPRRVSGWCARGGSSCCCDGDGVSAARAGAQLGVRGGRTHMEAQTKRERERERGGKAGE